MRTRRTFGAEFKREAVQRADERRRAGVPLTHVARELGITDHLLRSWKRQIDACAGRQPIDVFPGHGRLPSEDEEIRRLERENRRLSQENAFLKTAAAYFAKKSR